MGTVKRTFANNLLTSGKIDATDALSGTIPATNLANASLTNVTAFPSSLGGAVSSVASDPPSPDAGQVWYNTTSGALKQYIGVSSWASGGNLNTARTGNAASRNSSSTSSIITFGGFSVPFAGRSIAEQYDGSAWTEVGDMNSARGQLGGSGGSATSAIAFGGETYPTPANITNTEVWNGTSWTEVNDLNTAGRGMGNCGISTAALSISGVSRSTLVEQWNGTSWTETTDVPATIVYTNTFGTVSAGLTAGGNNPPGYTTAVLLFDGTTWTPTTSLSVARAQGQAFGIQTSGIVASSAPTLNTEQWDGSTWTEVADMATSRQEGGSGGSSSDGLVAGGQPATAATEEWSVGLGVQTITAS